MEVNSQELGDVFEEGYG